MEHSYSCPYPEGCSCGAEDFNEMESENDRLRAELSRLHNMYQEAIEAHADEEDEVERLEVQVGTLEQKNSDALKALNMFLALVDANFHGVHIAPYREWIKIQINQIIYSIG